MKITLPREYPQLHNRDTASFLRRKSDCGEKWAKRAAGIFGWICIK